MTIFGLTLQQLGIQIIGFVAMGFGIGSFQAKRRVFILLTQAIACSLWAVQMVLLGGTTGAMLNFIGIVRAVTYMFNGRYKWASGIWVPIFFSAAFITCGIVTWEGAISLLPTFAMTLSSFALFIKKERLIRLMSIAVSPPWLIYDALTGTVAGVMAEIFAMTSIVIALIRYRKDK